MTLKWKRSSLKQYVEEFYMWNNLIIKISINKELIPMVTSKRLLLAKGLIM